MWNLCFSGWACCERPQGYQSLPCPHSVLLLGSRLAAASRPTCMMAHMMCGGPVAQPVCPALLGHWGLRSAGTHLWGSRVLSGDIISFPEQFFALSFHKVYWFTAFWHYLVRRTQIGCLYMANQKSSVTVVDGFWDMQLFSYDDESHHNTFKSYFSWCSHQYYRP